MGDKNPFGGGNPHFMYVPMSELEQEALSRLVEAGDLHINVVDWGVVNKPRIVFGDARLSLYFRLSFDRPEAPVPVYFFDLELETGTGLMLVKERLSTTYAGRPIQVAAGMFYDLVWDIQVFSMDPRLVKALLPGAIGLTSRLQDKDTGAMTLQGNMKLNSKEKALLRQVRKGEAAARADTVQQAVKATEKAKPKKKK